MRKVIIPFNGGKFSEGAFSYAANLNETKPILLTGIFLPHVDFARFFLFPVSLSESRLTFEKKAEEENIQKNIERFSSLCEQNNIQYKIHRNLDDFAIPELMIAVEYQGLNSKKSGHTTLLGYTKDTDKFNLAISKGWKVLAFTILNYQTVLQEVQKNIK